ncbi:hypothetical protein F5884DRAFT_780334 [Xylogone sp. PMI_703]|nr:hypothetical protein F5884DRAFT_780334 [Xylogone sp. PMI_703]
MDEPREDVQERSASSDSGSDTDTPAAPLRPPLELNFVMHDDQVRVRSIASRASWARRRHNALSRRRSRPSVQRRIAPRNIIQPEHPSHEHEEQRRHERLPDRTRAPLYEALRPLTLESSSSSEQVNTASSSAPRSTTVGAKRRREDEGLPDQIYSGVKHAFSLAKVDPFDTMPVSLTAKDQGLLHHWLSTYATMMFDQSIEQSFNPMREVWVPIDFSNAASFHGMLAHAAAHVAYLKGESVSAAAIEHKLEALRLVNNWLQDPVLAISDDAFSAVLGLLTFERYWGSEEEWSLHLRGLRQMTANRGGLDSFQENWRLGLVVEMVLSMSKPSWFFSSNSPTTLSLFSIAPPASSLGLVRLIPDGGKKLQSLWFLSFIQDLRTIKPPSSPPPPETLDKYPGITEALECVGDSLHRHLARSRINHVRDSEMLARMKCLFYIAVTVKDSTNQDLLSISHIYNNSTIQELEASLTDNQDIWKDSVQALHQFLFNPSGDLDFEKVQYVEAMVDVAGSLNDDMWTGLERCLLDVLRAEIRGSRARNNPYTVDSLLASMYV